MLGSKTRRNKFLKTEIIQSIFSNPDGRELEINNRRKTGKFHIHLEVKQHTHKQPMGQRRNHKVIKKTAWGNWKHNIPRLMGCSKKKKKLRGKFIVVKAYIKREERFQKLWLHLGNFIWLNLVKLVHDYIGSWLFFFLYLLNSPSPLHLSRFSRGRRSIKGILNNSPWGRQSGSSTELASASISSHISRKDVTVFHPSQICPQRTKPYADLTPKDGSQQTGCLSYGTTCRLNLPEIETLTD